MKQLVLEKIVVSGFPPVNKRCLWLKGNTFYYWYNGAWRSTDSNIDIDDLDKVVEQTVKQEITNVIGDAPEAYNTLGELAGYIEEHESESSERDKNIEANTSAIEELKEKVEAGSNDGWEG